MYYTHGTQCLLEGLLDMSMIGLGFGTVYITFKGLSGSVCEDSTKEQSHGGITPCSCHRHTVYKYSRVDLISTETKAPGTRFELNESKPKNFRRIFLQELVNRVFASENSLSDLRRGNPMQKVRKSSPF